CRAFERLELRVGHSTSRVLADSFVNILNRDGVTLKLARGNGAAIENKAWNIKASQGHHAAGDGLIAADQDDQSVEEIAAGDQLDGIGDDFTADQGSAHAFCTHGDAVGNGDSVELKRRAAGGANAFLHVL